MEQITIVLNPTNVTVYDGRVKGSRLKYRADKLEIYVKGAVPKKQRDIVNYHAFEHCRARHIPLISLVSYGWI